MSAQQVFVSGTEHPDNVLRTLGIIQQQVRQSGLLGTKAEFDSVTGQWVDSESGQSLGKFDLSKFKPKDLMDKVPAAAYYVLGSLDDTSAADHEQEQQKKVVAAEDKLQNDLQEFQSFLSYRLEEEGKKFGGGETEKFSKVLDKIRRVASEKSLDALEEKTFANLGGLDVDGKFLTQAEVKRFLLQYASRSIPAAAKKKKAVLITAVNHTLRDALGTGLVDLGAEEAAVGSVCVVGEDPSGIMVPLPGFSKACYLEGTPTLHELQRNSFSLVSSLAAGYQSKGRKGEPPSRQPVPVSVLAFGGNPSVRYDLVSCALKKWSIYLFEGSGGYVDQLVHIIGELEACGSHSDAETAIMNRTDAESRLIINAKPTVVSKGTVVDQLTQHLAYAVDDDATLESSWRKYIVWTEAADRYRRIFKWQMVTILVLGITATFLSVFQTMLLLMWTAEVAEGSTSELREVYWSINMIVIVLPIMTQLAQAITTKMNAGGKWAAFATAGDKTIRDIYLMRSSMAAYSQQAIRRKNQGEQSRTSMDEEAGGADAMYHSRQELLHIQLERHTLELNTALGEGASMKYPDKYDLPKFLDVKDNGFGDLTPDDYVEFRVQPILDRHLVEVTVISNERRVLEFFVHLFNTLGTLLAAVATYGYFESMNLQAWVSLTTALVSALSRFDHWMMLEWRQKKFNETTVKLTTIIMWWTSRGARGGRAAIRDQLGLKTEQVLDEESQEYAKQLKTSVEAAKKATEEMDTMQREATNQANATLSKGLQQIAGKDHIAVLNAENILAAISNPSSSKARLVKAAIDELNGDIVAKHMNATTLTSVLADFPDFAAVASQVVDDTGCLSALVQDIQKLFPGPVVELLEDQHHRTLFVRGMSNPDEVLNMHKLIQVSSYVNPKLCDQMKVMPIRLALEAASSAVQGDLSGQFEDALRQLGLTPYQMTVPKHSIQHTIDSLMPLVASHMPWRLLERKTLLQLIPSPEVRAKMGDISDGSLRCVLKRVEFLYGQGSSTGKLLTQVAEEIGQLELQNAFLPDDKSRIELADVSDRLLELGFDFDLLPTSSMMQLLPEQLQQRAARLDLAALRCCIKRMRDGTPMHRCTVAALLRLPEKKQRQLEVALRVPRRKEQFALACANITQEEIFSQNKEYFLRKIRGSGVADKNFVEDLRALAEDDIKSLVSRIRSECGNSYVGRLFDELDTETSTIDVPMMLSYEDQTMLLHRLKEFDGEDEVNQMSKKNILSRVGVRPLCKKLAIFSLIQLKEVIQRLMKLTGGTLYIHTMQQCLSMDDTLQPLLMGLGALSTVEVGCLVSHLLLVEPGEADSVRFLDYACDVVACRLIQELGLSRSTMRRLVKGIKQIIPDLGAADAFAAVAGELEDQGDMLDTPFGLPAVRPLVVNWMTSKVQSSELSWRELERVINSGHDSGLVKDLLTTLCDHGLDLDLGMGAGNRQLAVVSLCGSLLMSTPLFIFTTVATSLREYNVRRIFRRMESRLVLAPLMLELRRSGLDPKDEDVPRQRFLSACERLPAFSVLVNDLRTLPKRHLLALFKEVSDYLEHRALGKLYTAQYEAQVAAGQVERNLDLTAVAEFIKPHVKQSPVEVKTHFGDFDARTFYSRTRASTRFDILRIYVPNEVIANRASQWDENTWGELFTFFRTRVTYQITTAGKKRNRLDEKSQWAKRRHVMTTLKVLGGGVKGRNEGKD